MFNINFTANYIKPAVIKKNDGRGNFCPYKVSVVEFDNYNKNDEVTLRKISREWDDDFSTEIYLDFIENQVYRTNPKRHFFAITLQAEDHEHLRNEEIMGLAEFEEGKNINELLFLQVNPKQNFSSNQNEYKHIGTAMLNFLETYFIRKPIKVAPVPSAYDFYKKNEFTPMPKNNSYMWKA